MKTLKLMVCGGAMLAVAIVPAAEAENEMPSALVAMVDESGGSPEVLSESTNDASELPVPAASGVDESSEERTADVPAAPDPSAVAPEVEMPEAMPAPRELGEVGYDSEGRPGRIHVVVRGDTLWDISDAYLGTPWVWPSVWTDNRNIENPHRIFPDDRIWITDSEMRVVTRAEAETMLNANPPAGDAFPADQIDTVEVIDGGSPIVTAVPAEQMTRRVSLREWVGLISSEKLAAAASIVKRIPEQELLAQFDDVYIGLGEGAVKVGDQFEIVRQEARVFDPATNRFLGHHLVSLGWLEVIEVHGETSIAQIGRSGGEIMVGDKLLPRRPESMDIAIQPSPEDVAGEIVFFPQRRVVIGPLDFVYLNRGTLDGLETGSPLEVIRGADLVREPVRNTNVEVPNRVIARLLVIDAQPDTSVALVAEAETDLLVGDIFRGSTP